MGQDTSVSLVQAAVTLGRTYRATFDLVCRRELRAHQDGNRRWWVDREDLERLVREQAARRQAVTTA
jgi:hypothetical protein